MDVWFREDVARVVRAARRAGREATACLAWEEAEVLSREMAAYWRGDAAALSTIGAAFGLSGEGAADGEPQRVSGWESGSGVVSGWGSGGRP
jgi:hypothetical protein